MSPRLKCYYFSHSRASRIQKFFFSDNHGGQQYFSMFHGPSTLKSISGALIRIKNLESIKYLNPSKNTADSRLFEPALVRTSRLFEPFFIPRGYTLTSSTKNSSVIRNFSCSNFRLFEPISEPPWPIKLSVIRIFSFF